MIKYPLNPEVYKVTQGQSLSFHAWPEHDATNMAGITQQDVGSSKQGAFHAKSAFAFPPACCFNLFSTH